jgi:hypothetical protein
MASSEAIEGGNILAAALHLASTCCATAAAVTAGRWRFATRAMDGAAGAAALGLNLMAAAKASLETLAASPGVALLVLFLMLS